MVMPCGIGPISDLINRQAYVAAYDRRLRHPAWVCLSFIFSLSLVHPSLKDS